MVGLRTVNLKEKFEKIGMKVLSGDSALFTMHEKGKLIGLVWIHVDDIFITGNKTFKEIITTKLTKLFQFSKVEERNLGCEIEFLSIRMNISKAFLTLQFQLR